MYSITEPTQKRKLFVLYWGIKSQLKISKLL